jgi:hypothetical protein
MVQNEESVAFVIFLILLRMYCYLAIIARHSRMSWFRILMQKPTSFGDRKDRLERYIISSTGFINRTFLHTSFELSRRNSLWGPITLLPAYQTFRDWKPHDVVTDNMTRWLSQLYMIRRALILRPALEELSIKDRRGWTRRDLKGWGILTSTSWPYNTT